MTPLPGEREAPKHLGGQFNTGIKSNPTTWQAANSCDVPGEDNSWPRPFWAAARGQVSQECPASASGGRGSFGQGRSALLCWLPGCQGKKQVADARELSLFYDRSARSEECRKGKSLFAAKRQPEKKIIILGSVREISRSAVDSPVV